MQNVKLYMLLLGCTPNNRHTEQHDVYFGVAPSLKSLVPEIIAFWPEANGKIHIDAWREVTAVGGCAITIAAKTEEAQTNTQAGAHKLFFINLGGYKQNEFEEYHYKMLAAGRHKGDAVQQALQTVFYKHTGFKTAESHIDDRYGVDVDDLYEIQDILPAETKRHYSIIVTPALEPIKDDELHLGYFKLDKL